MPPASAASGATGGPAGSSVRRWVVVLLGTLPQVLLALLLLLQGRGLSGSDAKMQSQLGLLAAAVVLFWSLVGCSALALWSRARPLASAFAWERRLDSFLLLSSLSRLDFSPLPAAVF